jgi:hypothetical protein
VNCPTTNVLKGTTPLRWHPTPNHIQPKVPPLYQQPPPRLRGASPIRASLNRYGLKKVNILSDIKDALKQFINSRLQEATRAQAIYPDRVYVASGCIRQLSSGNLHKFHSSSSCYSGNTYDSHHDTNYVQEKKDFKW